MRLTIIYFSIILCGLAATSHAQVDEASVKKRMWSEKFPLPTDSVREKYKDQQAVMLYRNEIHEYSRKRSSEVDYDNYLHIRVLLLNAAAVEDYSDFSFSKLGLDSYRRKGTLIGIKVVKPDGSESEVELDEGVKMRLFRDAAENRETKDSYNKIAIENLEQGDILDFYIAKIKRVYVSNYNYETYYAFDPEVIPLISDYPVLDGRVSLLVEKNCFINLLPPEGHKEPEIIEKDDKVYYELRYSSDEKVKEVQWDAPMVTRPVLKFQVLATQRYSEVNKHITGNPGVPKIKTEEKDFQKLLSNLSGTKIKSSRLLANNYKFIRDQRHNTSSETMIRDMFYFTRHFLYFDFNENDLCLNFDNYDEFDVIRAFSIILKRFKIEHDVFIGVDKNIGNIDNALFYDEFTPGIKVETANGPVYIYTPGVHSMFQEPEYGMQGTKIYSVAVTSDKKHIPVVKTDYLPNGNPDMNLQIDSLRVTFTGEENEVLVNRKLFVTGGVKEQFSGIIRLQHLYFMDEVSAIDAIGNLSFTQNAHQNYLVGLFTKGKEEELKYSQDMAKIWLDEVNGIKEPQAFTLNIKSQGRSKENPAFRFSMNFRTDDILSHAGDHLVVDMVKLFGKFAGFNEKEKERSGDIYMQCPRTLKWYIEIEIPEGYRVSNPEVFNGSMQNSTGGFECRLTDQEGKLIIEVTKTYNHDYEPLDNWSELLSMLEYSMNLSQQKLVLSKIEGGN